MEDMVSAGGHTDSMHTYARSATIQNFSIERRRLGFDGESNEIPQDLPSRISPSLFCRSFYQRARLHDAQCYLPRNRCQEDLQKAYGF